MQLEKGSPLARGIALYRQLGLSRVMQLERCGGAVNEDCVMSSTRAVYDFVS
jgi:hypothetical protein